MQSTRFATVLISALVWGLLSCAAPAAETDPLLPGSTPPYPAELLARLQAAARRVPGTLPTEVRYLKVAETHRTEADVLEEGAAEQPYVMARTAFQVVFPDGWIMIDAGMDAEVHRFFGGGREEPYWPQRNEALQQALRAAKLIVITHEHGDHVAGVIRTPYAQEVAPRTLLTKRQAEVLTLAPQMPEIRLTPDSAARYLIVDYALLHPVAPGVVLLKAPGHTHGSQMVYVETTSAHYLFIGDVAWAMDGVVEARQKPAAQSARIREDREAIAHQLDWLSSLATQEDVVIVPSHDERRLLDLERRGLLTAGLAADRH